MRHVLILSVLAAAVACEPGSKNAGQLSTSSATETGSPTAGMCEAEVHADDYDRSCSEHADCISVFEGLSTNACRECGFAAINVGDFETYESDLGPLSCVTDLCAADCQAGHGDPATCVEGQCELGEPPLTFPCGENGGTCKVGTELCVVETEDMCSACVPLQAPCRAADGCDCIDSEDFTAWDTPCADAPVCEQSGDGLLVRCTADGWGCG